MAGEPETRREAHESPERGARGHVDALCPRDGRGAGDLQRGGLRIDGGESRTKGRVGVLRSDRVREGGGPWRRGGGSHARGASADHTKTFSDPATRKSILSMGPVAYTSTIARRDHYSAEVERERLEMVDMPDLERQEVREILQRWDFQGDELEEMVDKITSKPKAWLEIMMAHELNLAPVDPKQARKSAILVGFAAIIGSLIPLAPFFVVRPAVIGGDVLQDLWMGIAASMIVSAATLFLIGWYKAWITIGRAWRGGVQVRLFCCGV